MTKEFYDDTMESSVTELRESVVGRRIVSADHLKGDGSYSLGGLVLTLDNGDRVEMVGEGDCCAYTELDYFLRDPDSVEHVITDVNTEDDYQTWHIYAGLNDVMKLGVSWSEGSGYYAYGFRIQVKGEN